MKDTNSDCQDCPKSEPEDDSRAPGQIADFDLNRILVTGAGGFVGQSLCKALDKLGFKLRVLVRNDSADHVFKPLNAEIYKGDIREKDVVDWACDGVSGIFHLASIVQRAGAPDGDFWDTHVTATKHLMEAAKKFGVKRVVHCSTIGVLGHISDPPADETAPYNVDDIYQVTKAEGEKVALEFHKVAGVPVTVVRPAAVYGPGDRRLLKLFKLVAEGKFRMIGSGETFIHPVYIDDLIDGMILAYKTPEAVGETYILGGSSYLSLKDWVEIIAKEAGVKVSSFSIPYAPVWLAAVCCEALWAPFGLDPPLYRRRVDFFVKNRAFSIKKASGELGYAPKISLQEGAKKAIEWYRDKGWIK